MVDCWLTIFIRYLFAKLIYKCNSHPLKYFYHCTNWSLIIIQNISVLNKICCWLSLAFIRKTIIWIAFYCLLITAFLINDEGGLCILPFCMFYPLGLRMKSNEHYIVILGHIDIVFAFNQYFDIQAFNLNWCSLGIIERYCSCQCLLLVLLRLIPPLLCLNLTSPMLLTTSALRPKIVTYSLLISCVKLGCLIRNLNSVCIMCMIFEFIWFQIYDLWPSVLIDNLLSSVWTIWWQILNEVECLSCTGLLFLS